MNINLRTILIVSILVITITAGTWLTPLLIGLAFQIYAGQLLAASTTSNGKDPITIACEILHTPDEDTHRRLKQAIQYLQKALSFNPHLDQAFLLQGRAHCLNGQPEGAIEDLLVYSRRRPGNPLGPLELGFAYLSIQEQDLGRTEWLAAGITAADFISRGEQELGQKNHQAALDWFEKASWLDSAWGRPWYLIGKTYLELNQLENAVQSYNQAIKLSPHESDPYYALGDVYLNRLRDNHKAIDFFLEITRIDPASIKAYLGLGTAHDRLDEEDLALDAYEQAVRLSDQVKGVTYQDQWNRIWPKYSLGDFFLRSNLHPEASRYFEQALEEDLHQYWAGYSLLGLGKIALASKEYEASSSYFEEALNKTKNPYLRSQIYLKMGELSLELGDPIRGILNLQKSLEEYPDNKGVHKKLADTLITLGRHAEAIEEYEKYLAKWPDDQVILRSLAEARKALESQDE